MNKNHDFDLDFNDGKTSKLERFIVYLIVICSLVSAICDIIQLVQSIH